MVNSIDKLHSKTIYIYIVSPAFIRLIDIDPYLFDKDDQNDDSRCSAFVTDISSTFSRFSMQPLCSISIWSTSSPQYPKRYPCTYPGNRHLTKYLFHNLTFDIVPFSPAITNSQIAVGIYLWKFSHPRYSWVRAAYRRTLPTLEDLFIKYSLPTKILTRRPSKLDFNRRGLHHQRKRWPGSRYGIQKYQWNISEYIGLGSSSYAEVTFDIPPLYQQQWMVTPFLVGLETQGNVFQF